METTEAARKWLDRNPEAVLLVDEASVRIRTIFGDGHELSLEESAYPGEVSGHHTGGFRSRRYWLVIKVRPRSSQDGRPLDLLHRLDDEWWLDNLHRAGGHLSITIQAQEDG